MSYPQAAGDGKGAPSNFRGQRTTAALITLEIISFTTTAP
jgi:hypothetical protein